MLRWLSFFLPPYGLFLATSILTNSTFLYRKRTVLTVFAYTLAGTFIYAVLFVLRIRLSHAITRLF